MDTQKLTLIEIIVQVVNAGSTMNADKSLQHDFAEFLLWGQHCRKYVAPVLEFAIDLNRKIRKLRFWSATSTAIVSGARNL